MHTVRRLVDKATKKKKRQPTASTSTRPGAAAAGSTTAIAGLANATRMSRRTIDHDTEHESAEHESAEHEDVSEPDSAVETVTDLAEVLEIIKTNAVWKDFAEEFGEDVVRAVIDAQGWARRGNDIVDSEGNPVDLKLVRQLLEDHANGAKAHGGRGGTKGADTAAEAAAEKAGGDKAGPAAGNHAPATADTASKP